LHFQTWSIWTKSENPLNIEKVLTGPAPLHSAARQPIEPTRPTRSTPSRAHASPRSDSASCAVPQGFTSTCRPCAPRSPYPLLWPEGEARLLLFSACLSAFPIELSSSAPLPPVAARRALPVKHLLLLQLGSAPSRRRRHRAVTHPQANSFLSNAAGRLPDASSRRPSSGPTSSTASFPPPPQSLLTTSLAASPAPMAPRRHPSPPGLHRCREQAPMSFPPLRCPKPV
jgi:hypothetical protein